MGVYIDSISFTNGFIFVKEKLVMFQISILNYYHGLQESFCLHYAAVIHENRVGIMSECCIEELLGSNYAHSLFCADSWMF